MKFFYFLKHIGSNKFAFMKLLFILDVQMWPSSNYENNNQITLSLLFVMHHLISLFIFLPFVLLKFGVLIKSWYILEWFFFYG